MSRLAAAMLCLFAAGCATDRGFAPADSNAARPRITLDIAVDTKGLPLGAYQLVVAFDPADARVVEVRKPDASTFQGAPRFSPAAFARGQLRVTGYSLRQPPQAQPHALVSVVFEQVGALRSHVGIDVERLYDTSAPPREITRFDVLPSRRALDFGRRDE